MTRELKKPQPVWPLGDKALERSAAKPRTCVLVLGMHRSGTSALTRVLNIAGARLPANLLGQDRSNRTGHWEFVPVIRYHDKILDELGSAWSDWRRLDTDRLPVRRREEIRTEIRDILAGEFADAPLFAVKDPRICRFAPLFIDALNGADCDVRAVLPLRNPLEVCESLEQRDGMSRTDAGLLWLRHVLDAEHATRGLERAFVSYSALLSDWQASFAGISRQIAVTWPHAAADIAGQVDRFLREDWRHHDHTTEDVLHDPALRQWIGEAYEALLVLENNPRAGPALATLDTVRAAFDAAAPVLHRMNEEARSKQEGEAAGLRRTLADAQDRAADLAASLAERDKETAALKAALSETERAVTALETDLAASLAERDKETAALKAALSETERAVTALEADLAASLAERDEETAALKAAIAKAEGKGDRTGEVAIRRPTSNADPLVGSMSKPEAGFRLASFTLMRNEAPLLPAFLDQLEEFFDLSIILNHSSDDSSHTIVEERNASSLKLFELQASGYPQKETANLFMRLIFDCTDIDYIFFLDCDEFLPFKNKGSLVSRLYEKINFDLLYLHWRNVVPEHLDGRNIFNYSFNQCADLSPFKKAIVTRRLYETNPNCTIEQGYHIVKGCEGRVLSDQLHDDGLYHIPVTSKKKYIFKIERSAAQLERAHHLSRRGLGTHWIELRDDIAERDSELLESHLRKIALNYPDHKCQAENSISLRFNFPYIKSRYFETEHSFLRPVAEATAPQDDPKAFVIHSHDGNMIYDSHQSGYENIREQISRVLRPEGQNGEIIAPRQYDPGETTKRNSTGQLAHANFLPDDVYDALVAPLFCLPEKMPPTAWSGHIPFMFALFHVLQPHRYVELGVHEGASFIAACSAAKSLGIDTDLAGVDTWQGDEHAGFYDGNTIYKNLKQYLSQNFSDFTLHRGLFDERVTSFEDKSIDLLHIDGFHTYEAVKNDYMTWLPKMKSDGVILFHDTRVYEKEFGVHQLWHELEQKFQSLNFKHCFGLGVLFLDMHADKFTPFRWLMEDACRKDFYYKIADQIGDTVPARMSYIDWLVRQDRDYRLEYEAIVNSTTWKMTAPFRRLVGVARRRT